MTSLSPRCRLARRLGAPTDRGRRTERGSVSVEMVVLMIGLFTLLFLGLQAGLYYHARSVAIAAAQEGAREAGSQTGSQASGIAAAERFISSAGGAGVIADTHVTGSVTATTATVTVTGVAMSVIPGVQVEISQSASVPVERLTR
jgi:Flp pilus assembly protein TadG